MADDLLHVGDQAFDTDDLTYAERREIKRIVKLELWDEEVDGEWGGFEEVPTDDYMAATMLVFLRRQNSDATITDALALKPAEVMREDPPTEPEPASKPTRSKRKTSAPAGTPE